MKFFLVLLFLSTLSIVQVLGDWDDWDDDYDDDCRWVNCTDGNMDCKRVCDGFEISIGAIVGIAIGAIILLIVIPVLICFCCACACFRGRKSKGGVHNVVIQQPPQGSYPQQQHERYQQQAQPPQSYPQQPQPTAVIVSAPVTGYDYPPPYPHTSSQQQYNTPYPPQNSYNNQPMNDYNNQQIGWQPQQTKS